MISSNNEVKKNVRRGFAPEDERQFSAESVLFLRKAGTEVRYLLNRGYHLKPVTQFVGDHYHQRGPSYGWAIVVLATPEHIFGRELVTAAYSEEPKDSLRKIVDRVKESYPEAAEKVILKLAGSSGTRIAVKKGKQS